jgi:hypothetical protein
MVEHDNHPAVDDDPRFPFTGCAAYVVVFELRQWCQHGPDHCGLHY